MAEPVSSALYITHYVVVIVSSVSVLFKKTPFLNPHGFTFTLFFSCPQRWEGVSEELHGAVVASWVQTMALLNTTFDSI